MQIQDGFVRLISYWSKYYFAVRSQSRMIKTTWLKRLIKFIVLRLLSRWSVTLPSYLYWALTFSPFTILSFLHNSVWLFHSLTFLGPPKHSTFWRSVVTQFSKDQFSKERRKISNERYFNYQPRPSKEILYSHYLKTVSDSFWSGWEICDQRLRIFLIWCTAESKNFPISKRAALSSSNLQDLILNRTE